MVLDINIRLNPFRRGDDRVRDLREEMIRDTNAFLSWALSEKRDLPRIPFRRVDEGGFAELLAQPGARALVIRWWRRTLDAAEQLR